MSLAPLADAQRQLGSALDALRAAGAGACGAQLLSLVTVCEGATRQLDRLVVDAVAAAQRQGVFTDRGYKTPASALSDLVGWERFEARRRVVAAESVTTRVGLDGTVLPARLPATAEVAGGASLRHVAVIARVLGSKTAERLPPDRWAAAEEQLAAKAELYTPTELQAWGTALVEALDEDGEQPDERPPALINELRLTRTANGGGKLTGRFDDAITYDAIATVIDANAKPLTTDDDRTMAERQAHALADVCRYVLDHGDRDIVPDCGGHRPHLNVLIRLEDLENRARAAVLDFGGTLTPNPCGCSPATPASRRPCSTARANPSTSDGSPAPSPTDSAGRSPPETADVHTRGAEEPPPGARSTTSSRGRTAAKQSCRTSRCCAASTTARSIPASGSAASATVSPSSSHRRGSTHSNAPAGEPYLTWRPSSRGARAATPLRSRATPCRPQRATFGSLVAQSEARVARALHAAELITTHVLPAFLHVSHPADGCRHPWLSRGSATTLGCAPSEGSVG
jgi:5-methylcytosine-specific restriction protein A